MPPSFLTPNQSPATNPKQAQKLWWKGASAMDHGEVADSSPTRGTQSPAEQESPVRNFSLEAGKKRVLSKGSSRVFAERVVPNQSALLAYCGRHVKEGHSTTSTKVSTIASNIPTTCKLLVKSPKPIQKQGKPRIQMMSEADLGSPINGPDCARFKISRSSESLTEPAEVAGTLWSDPGTRAVVTLISGKKPFSLQVESLNQLPVCCYPPTAVPELDESISLEPMVAPKKKEFVIKKQITKTSSPEAARSRIYREQPIKRNGFLGNSIHRAGNTLQKSANPETRWKFKHDIVSMTGYHREKEKYNQDYARYHLFTMSSGLIVRLYALADGHGTNGAQASQLAVESFLAHIEHQMLKVQGQKPLDEAHIKQLVHDGFEKSHKLMETDPQRRFKYSGTTLVLVLIYNEILFFCNTGDSRAIMGNHRQEGQNPACVCVHETTLHKPELPSEEERILSFGGIVSPFVDKETGEFVGPHRVWNAAKTEPGLATSRSLGDLVAQSLGVTYRPEIETRYLTPSDKILVLASDGVWDFLNSADVMKICNDCKESPEAAAKKIVHKSSRLWTKVGCMLILELHLKR